ncbi:MAG: cytochrome C assembly protein [Marinilabiliales bacterium]|nr:MAG: cytochrome C assembly protein [Marinilabiliales bacterium]
MEWISFPNYAIVTITIWVVSLFLKGIFPNNKAVLKTADIIIIGGIILLGYYIIQLWVLLERPPMRTLGETRLWYSLFLSAIGFTFFLRWRYYWFLVLSILFASMFLLMNIISPENFNKTLMPALLSPWFVPHVIVYIFAYSTLGASSLVALKLLIPLKKSESTIEFEYLADNLVYIGFAFLTMGLLFGALWAKEAWGHYWTWDPKETWAFLTWSVYLIYIHLRSKNVFSKRTTYWVLLLAFIVLLVCWFGVNYLPSAANSIHTYSS